MVDITSSSLPPPPPACGSAHSYPEDTLEFQAEKDPDYSTLQVASSADGLQVASPPTTSLPEARFPPAYRQLDTLPPGHPGVRAPSRFETPWEDISLKAGRAEEEEKDARAAWCCGLGRARVIGLLAAVAIIGILGVSLGVGLGLGLKKPSEGPPPIGTPYVTGTQTLPAWTAAATTGPSQPVSCPGNNLTLYTVVGTGSASPAKTGKNFLLTCDRDYNSKDGAVDLKPGGTPLGSMAECVEMCAGTVGCTACGWGKFEGVDTCWLKSSIGRPNVSPGWHFAVLESS